MFHDERFHHPHLKKSGILSLIWFLQAMWFSIALFIIPLYLFQIFHSWDIIWQINAVAWWVSVVITLLLSLLLQKFSRWILFKIAILAILLWLFWFLFISRFYEALWARSSLIVWWTIIWSILSLYLKDLSDKENLSKNQWIYQSSINIAWLIWPIWAWFLFDFFAKNKEFLENYFNWKLNFLLSWKYFEYNAIFAIAILFISSALITFLWAKFVNNHPHLQITKISKENDKHHHFINFKFIWEYFQNKFRTLSFLNILLLTIWFSTIWWFWFALLLKWSWLDWQKIWLFIWLLALPLATVEWFLDKIIKKVWSSINALILWYWILLFCLWIAFLVWYSNIYIFIFLFILAHVWVAIAEVLQQYQYFEWTPTKEDEAKFYSIHMIWWAIFRIIAPLWFWSLIAYYWVQNAFYFVPIPMLIFFIWLIIYKIKFEKNKV